MLLPYLKPKQVSGLIITQRKPDGSNETEHSEGNEDHALESAAEDLIRAIHSKDPKAVASALRAGFEILDCQRQGEDVAGEPDETK